MTPLMRCFLCPPEGEPITWVPGSDVPSPERLAPDFLQDLAYVGGVLATLAERWNGDELTVYVTRDPLQPLPSYGDHVVAVVLADEWARVPPYAGRVRAVFKRYGYRPRLLLRPFESPMHLTVLKLVQYGRKWIKLVPNRIVLWRCSRTLRTGRLPIFVFPLGYFRQDELPVVPILERPVDVLFYGSRLRSTGAGLRRLTGTVKGVGRSAMLAEAERLKAARPDLNVEVVVTDGFGSTPEVPVSYSEALMGAKFCLSPAGNSEETYRNYEAWRYGTIPISEGLLPMPFHDRSPYVQVRPDWKDLEDAVSALLDDPQRMIRLHLDGLRHWKDLCSEGAVGSWMAAVLADPMGTHGAASGAYSA